MAILWMRIKPDVKKFIHDFPFVFAHLYGLTHTTSPILCPTDPAHHGVKLITLPRFASAGIAGAAGASAAASAGAATASAGASAGASGSAAHRRKKASAPFLAALAGVTHKSVYISSASSSSASSTDISPISISSSRSSAIR